MKNKHTMTYRVPYADTDQMGVVYYANYLEYFERGRTEMLRSAGMPYSEMEKLGVFLPVREAQLTYFSSAHYDDLLTFVSWIEEMHGAKLKMACEVLNEEGTLLVRGSVTLVCVNERRRVMRLPQMIMEKCKLFLTEGENDNA